MKKIGFIFSMALSVLFTSCDKEDAKPGDPRPEGERITKVEYSNNEYTSFTYNADNSINKIEFVEAGETRKSSFIYANGTLGEIVSDDGIAYQFKYNNGKTSVVDVVEEQQGKVAFNDFVYYSASGYLQRITNYTMTLNPAIFPPFFRIEYDYYNDNTGNVKYASYYFWDDNINDFVLEKTIEYSQYDNKANPFAPLGIVGYLLFGVNMKNNPGKMVEKDANGQVVSTSTFAYTYNSKGLPVQAVETLVDNSGTETNTVKFKY